MLNSRNKKISILTIVVLSILFLGLFRQIGVCYAQGEEKSHKIPLTFELEEHFEINGKNESISQFDIDLGADTYNVTGVELNFTNIKMERQIKTIEDENFGYDVIYNNTDNPPGTKYRNGLGVQIDPQDDTILYGVYIFGFKDTTTTVNITVQIRGYNSVDNIPNNQIYLNQTLNMSIERTWYYQKFETPLNLSKNNDYYLVLNGSNLSRFGDGLNKYYWSKNNLFPKNPQLYSAVADNKDPNWKGEQGTSFLYKLDQKVNRTYYPEEIEMKAEINGVKHPIENGPLSGTGNLKLPNINFFPDTQFLNIPITNNDSITLNYTLDYRINLKDLLTSGGTVLIRESYNNTWTVNLAFSKRSNNYTLKFYYPQSWFNLSIIHSGKILSNITDYLDDGESLYIFNETLTDNVAWTISANSEKIPIDTEIINGDIFTPGADLVVKLNAPLLEDSNFSLVLYALDSHYENITQEYPFDDFKYTLPNINGNWTAFILWNNLSDAGVNSYNFTVSGTIIPGGGDGGGGGGGGTTVTGLDPLLVTIVTVIIIASVVAALASYQTFKSVKRKRDLELKKLQNKFIDILSLNYLLVVDKKTGLNVYEQFFAGKMIDASLISGFFEAIRNFGIELTGTYTQSQSVKLEYQESKIIMSEYRNFRLIFVMTENPSDDFLDSITKLSYDIQEKFGELLQDFKGDTTKFRDIRLLVENNFNVSFIAPLTVRDVSNLKLNDAEIAMINKAKAIMKQNNLNYFFTSFLLPEQAYDPKKTRTIFNLIEKKIFIPTKLQ